MTVKMTTLKLSLLKALIPEGLNFGANYLVEFEPHSLWYETSLAIAADSARQGIPVDYHTFMHIPDEVRKALAKLGIDSNRLEQENMFSIEDSYTLTTSLGEPEPPRGRRETGRSYSLDLEEWTQTDVRYVKGGVEENEKRRLHIDDNTSVLVQYNSEQKFIDHWRTHTIPYVRKMEWAVLHSAVVGVYSDAFYKQFESLCDGIIDVRAVEEGGQVEHYLRVRVIRAKQHDSRWRRLRLKDTGEVIMDPEPSKPGQLGISRWLKGPK